MACNIEKKEDAVGYRCSNAAVSAFGEEQIFQPVQNGQECPSSVIFRTGKSPVPVMKIAEGKFLAQCVLAALRGEPLPKNTKPFSARLGKLDTAEMQVMLQQTQVTLKETQPEALASEAGRCLHCDCRAAHNCKLRKLAQQYGAKSPPRSYPQRQRIECDTSHPDGLIFESGKCIRCGLCVQLAERRGDSLTILSRGFHSKIAPPFDRPLSQAITSNVATYAALCPVGAFTHRPVS